MFRTSHLFRRANATASISRRFADTKDIWSIGFSQKPLSRWQIIQTTTYSTNRPSSESSIDLESERKLAQQKLKADPSQVSVDSTTRNAFDNTTLPGQPSEERIQDGLMHDIGIVKDTFRLDKTPHESHILGLMGTLPYFATSLSSVFLTWNLTKEMPPTNAFESMVLLNHETAKHLLSIIEPLQLGYGAVIISFLGAIHWGLEYAEKTPQHDRTRFRYGMGVIAPVLAWPTTLMPLEYGLTAQFAAFVGLYFADSRASIRGWAPHWYGHYRFLLTAMVGLAIFISLVGRSRMETANRLSKGYLSTNMSRPGIADTETDWVKVEAEEKKKIKKEQEKREREAKRSEHEKQTGKVRDGDNQNETSDSGKQNKTEGESGDGKTKESSSEPREKPNSE